jgi:hypothetical protein
MQPHGISKSFLSQSSFLIQGGIVPRLRKERRPADRIKIPAAFFFLREKNGIWR